MRFQHRHNPTRVHSWQCTVQPQHQRQTKRAHHIHSLALHLVYTIEIVSWQGEHKYICTSLVDDFFTNIAHHTQMACKTLLNHKQTLITSQSTWKWTPTTQSKQSNNLKLQSKSYIPLSTTLYTKHDHHVPRKPQTLTCTITHTNTNPHLAPTD